MRKKLTTFLVWVVLVLVFIWLFELTQERDAGYAESFNTFRRHVEQDRLAAVRVVDDKLIVTLANSGETYKTYGVMSEELLRMLTEKGVAVHWGKEKRPLRTLGLFALPLLLILALFLYFLRRESGGTHNILSLRKSRARLLPESSKVRFADVGGAEEAKERLGDVIDFLKNPKRWKAAGARLPRGILLVGPPGCGKTLLARAVAGEADVPFFLVSASEFVEMFVGVGAARVRDMFETAAKKAPAVIFIDELDAVGRRRGSGIGTSHDEREQTLNQLLVCLDGVETHDQVVVLAATNRPDVLDKALLRPGRFEVQVEIPPPTRAERLEILRLHTRTKTIEEARLLEELAGLTEGYNGAALEKIANEAARAAVRRSRKLTVTTAPAVTKEDFFKALQLARSGAQIFNKLDLLLIESASQLAQPTGMTFARLALKQGSVVEGQLVWADGVFLKLRNPLDGAETVVPKIQIERVEVLEGTEAAHAAEPIGDQWAGRVLELA